MRVKLSKICGSAVRRFCDLAFGGRFHAPSAAARPHASVDNSREDRPELWSFRRWQPFCTGREVAIAFAQRTESVANGRFGSPRTRIGVQQKVDLTKQLTFKETKRTDATSLFAAPLYGPSLRYLQLIAGDAVAVDGTSTRIPIAADDEFTALLADEVDTALRSSTAYEHFDQLDTPILSSDSIDDLGIHGFHPCYYRESRPEVKRAFLRKFLTPIKPKDSADYRRLTARLICQTIEQHVFESPAGLRACWYTGLLPSGEPLGVPELELRIHQKAWALFQARQIQRTVAEIFLRCFEIGLKNGAESINDVIGAWQKSSREEFDASAWRSLEEFIRAETQPVSKAASLQELSAAWHAIVHGKHDLYDDIEEKASGSEFTRAFRMLARWWIRLQVWLEDTENAQFLAMGDRSRMSLRWFSTWIQDRLSEPLVNVAEAIFSEIVFAQHIKVALARFDGQVQRLRFTLGDSGIIPTSEAAQKLGQAPVRMADRLRSFMGLLSDLEVIRWTEEGPIELGMHQDLLEALDVKGGQQRKGG